MMHIEHQTGHVVVDVCRRDDLTYLQRGLNNVAIAALSGGALNEEALEGLAQLLQLQNAMLPDEQQLLKGLEAND
jgi:hypothetical protein